MIGDPDLKVAKLYNMLPAECRRHVRGRTAANNATVRSVFVIGPDKKIKLMLTYPMTTGRNFDEILRVLDSMQLTAKHKVATPVNWKQGDDVIIAAAVSDEEAKKLSGGFKTFSRTCARPSSLRTDFGGPAAASVVRCRCEHHSSRLNLDRRQPGGDQGGEPLPPPRPWSVPARSRLRFCR